MKVLSLNASRWQTADHLYSDLLAGLGAPPWHGRNRNALLDSLSSDLNEVRPPLTVIVMQAEHLNAEMKVPIANVVSVFDIARKDRGAEVWFRLN
jgi:RNAse (barnase) inhibitor barstar